MLLLNSLFLHKMVIEAGKAIWNRKKKLDILKSVALASTNLALGTFPEEKNMEMESPVAQDRDGTAQQS